MSKYEKPAWISRRSLFGRAGAAVGASLLFTSNFASAQETKFSKEDSDYQDEPKEGQTCEYCALFIAPDSCRVVAGDVSPKGWCKYWASI